MIDARFVNDMIRDSYILRFTVTLEATNSKLADSLYDAPRSLFEKLLDEDSVDGAPEDKITLFLRATSIGDKRVKPLQGWKRNETRFPSIAKNARALLSIQASSVSSESAFSEAGNLITSGRSSLGNEFIKACMPIKSWHNFLQSLPKSAVAATHTAHHVGLSNN